jgi:magnesium transporter
MKTTYYRIAEGSRIDEISAESFFDQRGRDEGLYCVDIREPQPDELEQWLRSLNISEFATRLCLRREKVSAVIPLDQEVYFAFPVVSSESENEQQESYVSVLCLDSLVVSMEPASVSDANRVVEVLGSQLKQAKTSTSALLSTLLARESVQAAQRVDGLRAAVYELDERMDRDPESVEAEDIRRQKRLSRVYGAVVNGQAACLEQLRVLDLPFLSFDQHSTYLQIASVNAMAASQAVSRLDKTITDLSQRYDTIQQEKTNHRLAILTILSAIFMPLTLMAGIYGMNFEVMPELHFRWAYPIVMAAMLLIAIAMYRFFKTRGWLD